MRKLSYSHLSYSHIGKVLSRVIQLRSSSEVRPYAIFEGGMRSLRHFPSFLIHNQYCGDYFGPERTTTRLAQSGAPENVAEHNLGPGPKILFSRQKMAEFNPGPDTNNVFSCQKMAEYTSVRARKSCSPHPARRLAQLLWPHNRLRDGLHKELHSSLRSWLLYRTTHSLVSLLHPCPSTSSLCGNHPISDFRIRSGFSWLPLLSLEIERSGRTSFHRRNRLLDKLSPSALNC